MRTVVSSEFQRSNSEKQRNRTFNQHLAVLLEAKATTSCTSEAFQGRHNRVYDIYYVNISVAVFLLSNCVLAFEVFFFFLKSSSEDLAVFVVYLSVCLGYLRISVDVSSCQLLCFSSPSGQFSLSVTEPAPNKFRQSHQLISVWTGRRLLAVCRFIYCAAETFWKCVLSVLIPRLWRSFSFWRRLKIDICRAQFYLGFLLQ